MCKRLVVLSWILLLKINIVFSQEGGYAHPWSVIQNESITFYISTAVSPFTANLYKLDKQKTFIKSFSSLQGGLQITRDSAYWYGANWKSTFQYTIPNTLKPGVYRLDFPVSNNKTLYLLFIVRMINPGSYSKILVMLNMATWQAFNPWGGKSLFSYNSSDSIRSYKVSFQRPIHNSQYYNYDNQLIYWLENKEIPVEVCSNQDLDKNPSLINNYSIMIKAGQDEFWSMAERKQIEKFVNNGNKLIILSGATCWWQIRYEDDYTKIVCYKNALLDPLKGINDSLVTVNWYSSPVKYPENSLIGTSYRNGGTVAHGGILPKSEGYGDYAVYSSHHWVYTNTELNEGDEFGWKNDIVGYLTDGALYQWKNGLPVPTGVDKTPLNFTILGLSPASNGLNNAHATMGIYYTAKGGAVFNASTTDWVRGINNDSIVSTITMNVIRKFQSGSLPPDILSWAPSMTTTKLINKEYLPLNKRDIIVTKNKSVYFSIQATDPVYSTVTYIWKKENNIVSKKSLFTFHSKNENRRNKNIQITAYACNPKDTSSISWNVFMVNHIHKLPKAIVNHSYSFPHRNSGLGTGNWKKNSRYSLLIAPYWMKIDSISGTITGLPVERDLGKYSVLIKVSLRNNKYIYRAYEIEVIRFNRPYKISNNQVFTTTDRIIDKSDTMITALINSELDENDLIKIYPNPFRNNTTLEINTNKLVSIRIRIIDVTGKEVETIADNLQISGNYSVTWEPKNKPLGIYFLLLEEKGKINSNYK